MIEEEVSSHPFCSVEFKASPSSFTVIFRKDITSLLDEMDNQILKLVQVPTKSGEIAVRLNVSKNTILKRIDKLENLGLIEKKGSGPRIMYMATR
jgi:HTH domain.